MKVTMNITVLVSVAMATLLSAESGPPPFLLERTLSVLQQDGQLRALRREVICRSSSGQVVQAQSVGPVDSGQYVRHLLLANGSTVTVFDPVRLKSTMPANAEPSSVSRYRGTSPRNCGVTAPDVLLRHDQVSGVEVAVVESIVPGKFRITRWVAPNLACEDLYYRSEALQPDGSYRVTAEAKTTHLELSEPASSWFDVGSQYDETKPSIAHEKLARFLNIQLSDKEKADLDRQLKAKDQLHTERTEQ